MSAAKFGYQSYKLFEPQFHTDRPIIVDADAIESPETVTLRYEEEAAARASGGGVRGDSPPGLLTSPPYSKPQPPQMHAFESSRPYQDSQYQYSAQSFPSHQPENATVQLNQMAFAANGSAGQYLAGPVMPPTLISYQPPAGTCGTKMMIKISSPYDLTGVTSNFYLLFGQQRCPAHAVRDTHDASGYGYVVSGDVPPFNDTRSSSVSVPVTLMIDISEAQQHASMEIGTFTYHDSSVVADDQAAGDVTRSKPSLSPEHRVDTPKQDPEQIPETATNTYGYPPESQQSAATTYDAAYTTNNSNGNMIGAYHRPSYADDYSRHIPPPIKTSSQLWNGYGTSLTSIRSPGMSHAPHTTISRPGISSLPAPTSSNPQLVRTSTLQSSGSPNSSFNPYAVYSPKATLKIVGELDSMATNWSKEEWDNRRRIVLFRKHQQGSTLTASFKPVGVNERPTNSICISCIYWAEKKECYVTSVDTIYLLEQLVVTAPNRFSVEEKNRIRRNLEGFRPLTVSKAKPESEEFFKIIMAFPNPKPRNIEKDVKVFPWKILAQALKKIISKYSASPSSTVSPNAMIAPVSSASPGLYPHPSHAATVADNGYGQHDHHAMASPRSLASASSTWATSYPGRPLSPSLKSHSPAAGGIRIPSLPAYGAADSRHAATSGYSMAPQPPTRWDTASTNGYLDASAVPAYTSHQHQSQVYSAGGYADGGHRS